MHLRPQSNRHHANARPRARAHRRRCMLATTRYDSSTPCRTERHFKADRCKRLGSRSRDPIGYEGSRWSLLEYVNGSPLNRIDPTGRVTLEVCLWEMKVCQEQAQEQAAACVKKAL